MLMFKNKLFFRYKYKQNLEESATLVREGDKKHKKSPVQGNGRSNAELKKNPENARKIISVGNYQSVTKDTILLAAAMQAIQVMYNMQEAITKT